MHSVLQLDDVGKTFADGTVTLAGVSLNVRDREFVGIVGPSGCGKTTLLRISSGLDEPTSGTVMRNTDRIGYVFQNPTLLPWRTVLGNVELLLELDGIARAERRERAERAVELVGLHGFARHRPAALSGGMLMRASLARTLVTEPRLLLLDEPFGALDEITRLRLAEELGVLVADRAVATLLITHSVAEAVFLSGTVLVMSPRPGRVIARMDVPFPFPRKAELRHDARFAELVAAVTDRLRDGAPADRDD